MIRHVHYIKYIIILQLEHLLIPDLLHTWGIFHYMYLLIEKWYYRGELPLVESYRGIVILANVITVLLEEKHVINMKLT